MTESLGSMQRRFALDIARLIVWIYDQGWAITYGDAFRAPKVFGRMGVEKGYGRKNSCHKLKLANDLNLFKPDKNGIMRYCKSTKDHAEIGKRWESMGKDHRWGGHYNDGNHYSFTVWGYQ